MDPISTRTKDAFNCKFLWAIFVGVGLILLHCQGGDGERECLLTADKKPSPRRFPSQFSPLFYLWKSKFIARAGGVSLFLN